MSNNYIKCKSDTYYAFSYESDNIFFQATICFYDENKKFITGASKDQFYDKSIVEISPTNAHYIKIAYSIRVNDIETNRYNIQLEESKQKTKYEEYFYIMNI